ncbi:unnamed protein product, partial [Ectocarpus fasciculatus]
AATAAGLDCTRGSARGRARSSPPEIPAISSAGTRAAELRKQHAAVHDVGCWHGSGFHRRGHDVPVKESTAPSPRDCNIQLPLLLCGHHHRIARHLQHGREMADVSPPCPGRARSLQTDWDQALQGARGASSCDTVQARLGSH